jgi:protein-arginine kinase activator protein McsA
MSKDNDYMTIYVCDKCGWAHFGLTKDAIEKSAVEFMQYYDQLSEEQRKSYYGINPITKEDFNNRTKICFNCGGSYKNFHIETPADKIPDGCTIQGILIPD